MSDLIRFSEGFFFCLAALVILDWVFFVRLRAISNIANRVRREGDDAFVKRPYIQSINWLVHLPLMIGCSISFALYLMIDELLLAIMSIGTAAALLAWRFLNN